MTNRLPPRVAIDDLRDPERWLRDHVYTSDEVERAYEEQERPPRPRERPTPIGETIAWFIGMAAFVGLFWFWGTR